MNCGFPEPLTLVMLQSLRQRDDAGRTGMDLKPFDDASCTEENGSRRRFIVDGKQGSGSETGIANLGTLVDSVPAEKVARQAIAAKAWERRRVSEDEFQRTR